MTVREITTVLEGFAPLALQDDYDNAGLQVGDPSAEVTGVLVCLDVTEAVLDEAARIGCNFILSHHPLIFRPLRHVTGATYQERCVAAAIRGGISIYSAHTNLDNAEGGVNYRIASMLGVEGLSWLQAKPVTAGRSCGSGVVGTLAQPVEDSAFLGRIKDTFGVDCLMHNGTRGRLISKVAICGGAGAFLLRDAVACDADCFITGEMHYHDWFGHESFVEGPDGLMIVEMGHFQSERFTQQLLADLVRSAFPQLRIELTQNDTNPIHYSI